MLMSIHAVHLVGLVRRTCLFIIAAKRSRIYIYDSNNNNNMADARHQQHQRMNQILLYNLIIYFEYTKHNRCLGAQVRPDARVLFSVVVVVYFFLLVWWLMRCRSSICCCCLRSIRLWISDAFARQTERTIIILVRHWRRRQEPENAAGVYVCDLL